MSWSKWFREESDRSPGGSTMAGMSKKNATATKKTATKKTATKKTATKKTATKKTAKTSARAATGASTRLDARIAELGDWRGERLAEIRALIREVDPAVVEDWKWMGSPVWSHDGMYALANAHKNTVKLTFHHGAQLPDPKKLFNSMLGGNKWRAIDFREGDEIDRIALVALLRAAVRYNITHSVPKSRGSRP